MNFKKKFFFSVSRIRHFTTDHTGDGTTCTDIDECALLSTNTCHAKAGCTNSVGSYKCDCLNGYSGDGKSCVDIDECAKPELNDCHLNGKCTNTDGGFECKCNNGYNGDGVQCADIDECDAANPVRVYAIFISCIIYDLAPFIDGFSRKIKNLEIKINKFGQAWDFLKHNIFRNTNYEN